MLRRAWTGLRRYPSVAISLLIILFLAGISLHAIINIPLSSAMEMWNAHSSERWDTPRGAPPVWTNLFRRENLPQTLSVCMGDFEPTTQSIGDSAQLQTVLLTFDYGYSTFPSGLALSYDIRYKAKPILTLTWVRPDGVETELYRGIPPTGAALLRFDPTEAFADSSQTDTAQRKALRGEYGLRVDIVAFGEEETTITGELVALGSVYGVAGSDYHRRDVAVGLCWGAPVALMFGFLAAFSTTLLGFALAAIGAWYGGWIDATLQRITEVNMMIPFLPTIMMVGWFLSSNIWVLLGFIVGFSILTGRLKTYRAMFLQLKSAEYIEAARAYGASNLRTVFRYLIPHMFPAVLPHIVLGVPRFVFLEASLAFLGIADPKLLTWGKMLSDARHAMYTGEYQSVLAPAFLLLLTGLSFSMLGYTLDRIFNPKLREV